MGLADEVVVGRPFQGQLGRDGDAALGDVRRAFGGANQPLGCDVAHFLGVGGGRVGGEEDFIASFHHQRSRQFVQTRAEAVVGRVLGGLELLDFAVGDQDDRHGALAA